MITRTVYSVQWYRKGARDAARQFRLWVRSDIGKLSASARGIEVLQIGPLRRIDNIVADKFEERMAMEIWIGYRIELTATVAELDPLNEADPDQQPLITFTFSEGTMPITERVGLILYDSGELVPGYDGSAHYGWEEPMTAGQPPAVGRGTPNVIPDKLLGNTAGPVSIRSLLIDRQFVSVRVSGPTTPLSRTALEIITRGQSRQLAVRLIVGVPRQLDNAQPPYDKDGASDDDRAIIALPFSEFSVVPPDIMLGDLGPDPTSVRFGDTSEKLLDLFSEQPQGVRPDYGETRFRIQVIETDIPQTRPSALSVRAGAMGSLTFLVSWAPARVAPDTYVARWREQGTTWDPMTDVEEIQNTTVSIMVPQAGTYEVQVASVFEDKSRSQWAPATPLRVTLT